MAVVIKKMGVRQWVNVPDNPRQRDTVRHANKAKRKHLKEADEAHGIVFAAMLDGEITWKLDGHTRAYLWDTGELELPKGKLTVVCFNVSSEQEAAELYTRFDSQSATENATDRLSGACRECGLTLTSRCLRSHKFVVALQCADGKNKKSGPNKEYELVQKWQREIAELDSWDLGGMHTSLVALGLVLIRAGLSADAERFFKALDQDAGTKTDKGSDGVQALTQHWEVRKANRTTAGWDNIEDLFERAYTCFLKYTSGQRIKGTPQRASRDVLDAKAKEKDHAGN